jgi:putative ABC transport system permease protein
VLDLMKRTDLFDGVAGVTAQSLNLEGMESPQRVSVTRTFGPFFDVAAGRPLLGRLYRPEDSENGNARQVVLSHAFWQQAFGGDLGIVGRSIQLSGRSYEVIGVMPREFRYPRVAQMWAPFTLDSSSTAISARGSLFVNAIARVRPGITREQLAQALVAESRRWEELYEQDQRFRHTLFPTPFVEWLAGELRRVLLVLLGAVVLVLLIACANVASLQLVRAAERGKELALRAALGAGRRAIARQLLVESLVLALAAGALGAGLGVLTVRLLAKTAGAQYRLLQDVPLDARVLAFAAAVTVVAALLFGAFPAVRAARVDLHGALKESSRGASAGVSRGRFLQGSVVVQTALALVLLLGSGVMIRTLSALLESDPGFRAEERTTMTLSLPGSRYPNAATQHDFHDRLLARVGGLPGVQSAATAWGLPFSDAGSSTPFDIPGKPRQAGDPERHARFWFVGGDYFRTMGIRIVRGRAFRPTDTDPGEGPRAVVIDETMARQYFPNEDPIGRSIQQIGPGTIVGVAANVKHADLTEPDKATAYYFIPQLPWGAAGFTVVVRSALPGRPVAAMVQNAVKELDPMLPVYDVLPMAERVERSLGSRRLAMTVLTGFAALALLLAVLGIYGVISYTMSQRTHEIGIRVALGARPRDVTGMVVRSGLGLAALGLVAGTLVFLSVGRVLSALLYGVGTRDPVTLALCIALLTTVALCASYLPARRASRVDPIRVVRGE